jgi:hypothetical protein
MSETLTIRLGERLANALREQARQTGLTQGEIARRALESHLDRGNQLTVMGQHFGTVSGPSDLSTNRKYRRSWKKGHE